MLSRRELLCGAGITFAGVVVFGLDQRGSSKAQVPPVLDKHVYLPLVTKGYQGIPRVHIKGLCYSPYRDGQNPDWGPYPSDDEIKADIGILGGITTYIRTYGSDRNLKNIPSFVTEIGANIKVNAGCYIGPDHSINAGLLANLIEEAKLPNVISVNIGNETQQFGTVAESYLIDCLSLVRQNIPTEVSITTGDTWSQWLARPGLVSASDYIFAHFFPYWENPNPIPIENAVSFIKEKYGLLRQRYPGKRVVIGEAGWPSAGETRGNAVPSLENQRRFFNEFLSWVNNEQIDYYLFEMFDEEWKTRYEGEVGRHWGIYYSNRTPKHPGLTLK